MSGLVAELQADALNKEIRVSDLLRKALVVSRKLAIHQIEEWLKRELNGYSDTDDLPDYRTIQGETKAFNPYRGWIPIDFRNHEQAAFYSQCKTLQAIGELELLISRTDTRIHFPFSNKEAQLLMAGMELPLHPTLFVSPTEILKILETVRNDVLEWALELEEKGILGEGMSFSPQEKEAASHITNYFTNNFGNVTNSQFQQNSPNASQVLNIESNLNELGGLLEDIRKSILDLNLSSSARDELCAELETIKSQTNSPKPKNKIISESLHSIRTILEGAASNVLAGKFLSELAKFFDIS